MMSPRDMTEEADSLSELLRGYSAEVTVGDKASVEAAAAKMPRRSEVFIASLPKDRKDRQVEVASYLRGASLIPVPHIVARNYNDSSELEKQLRQLRDAAGVDRALILAGDRDDPAGELHSSLDILQTGLLSEYGIRRVFLSWYPEGHPRIADSILRESRKAKLALARAAGLEVILVSQFCFDAAPIIASARDIRSEGITAPLRVGVAGPASRKSLLKFAMICGVGASLRAFRERPAARNLLVAETPEGILRDVAQARFNAPDLGIAGIHFFTFASLGTTVDFALEHAVAKEYA